MKYLIVSTKISFSLTVQKEGGTQLKLIIEFPNDIHALFKPQRWVKLWEQKRFLQMIFAFYKSQSGEKFPLYDIGIHLSFKSPQSQFH